MYAARCVTRRPYSRPLTSMLVIFREDPERLRKMLLAPVREVSVELELLMDSGEVDTFKAVRLVHS